MEPDQKNSQDQPGSTVQPANQESTTDSTNNPSPPLAESEVPKSPPKSDSVPTPKSPQPSTTQSPLKSPTPLGEEQTTFSAPPPGSNQKLKSGRLGKLLALIIVFLGLGAAGWYGYDIYNQRDLGAAETFDEMLANSLNVSTFTQKLGVNLGIVSMDMTARSDYSDLNNIFVDAELDMTISFFANVNLETRILLDGDDVYIKYESVDIAAPEEFEGDQSEFPDEVLNKWIKIIENGLPLGASDEFGVGEVGGDLGSLDNPILLGNFSDAQDSELLGLINTNNIYSYSESDVVSETVGGIETYKYQIKINSEALVDLYEKVAEIVGTQDIESLQELSEQNIDEFIVWVDKQSKQLVKIEITQDGSPLEFEYSDFGAPIERDVPQAELTIEEFERLTSVSNP